MTYLILRFPELKS